MSKLSRRTFLSSMAGAVGYAASNRGGLGLQDKARSSGSHFPAGRYVDVHTHIGQRWGRLPALTTDALLKWMDAKEISQAVVLPLVSPESWDYPLSTDYVLKETAPHRDRLIPFCSIDPRTILLKGVAPKRALLERYVEAGAKGFGEHKPGVAIDHPGNIELFQACAEVGLPVLFHLDNMRNMDSPGLPGLCKVLEQVPDGIFIGHAQGFWASISGDVKQKDLQGYPRGKIAAGGALDVLMERFPGLYGDLSAGSGANAIRRDLEFGRDFVIRRADRLLFGTDFLRPEQPVPQFDLYDELALPDDVLAKVLRENTRSLLKIR